MIDPSIKILVCFSALTSDRRRGVGKRGDVMAFLVPQQDSLPGCLPTVSSPITIPVLALEPSPRDRYKFPGWGIWDGDPAIVS